MGFITFALGKCLALENIVHMLRRCPVRNVFEDNFAATHALMCVDTASSFISITAERFTLSRFYMPKYDARRIFNPVIVDGTHHIDPFPLTLNANDRRLTFRSKPPLIMLLIINAGFIPPVDFSMFFFSAFGYSRIFLFHKPADLHVVQEIGFLCWSLAGITPALHVIIDIPSKYCGIRGNMIE